MIAKDTHLRTWELHHRGYSQLTADSILMSAEERSALAVLQEGFNHLPADVEGRYKIFSNFVRMPGDTEVDLDRNMVGSTYYQSSELHPEANGVPRVYKPLDLRVRRNRALIGAIEMFWQITDMERIWPGASHTSFMVGVHMTRLRPTVDRPARAQPPRPHKDGELVTWIWTMNRFGISGGETEVYANGEGDDLGELLFRAPLLSTLEAVGVLDCAVSHDVRKVELLPQYRDGWRDNLLIDFAPLTPVTLNTRGRPVAMLPHRELLLNAWNR